MTITLVVNSICFILISIAILFVKNEIELLLLAVSFFLGVFYNIHDIKMTSEEINKNMIKYYHVSFFFILEYYTVQYQGYPEVFATLLKLSIVYFVFIFYTYFLKELK